MIEDSIRRHVGYAEGIWGLMYRADYRNLSGMAYAYEMRICLLIELGRGDKNCLQRNTKII